MFPPEFDYHRATTVEEAIDLLETHAERDPAVLAGGHGLLPAMKTGDAAPGVVVDVSEIDDLRGVETDDSVAIGALTTHATLADAPALRERATVLAETAHFVADTQIRNRGTIGGNLVEADPAADLPAAVVAADATLALRGPDGEREISAGEFFEGDGETALADRELLTQIRVPSAPESVGGAYAKKTDPASGFALVGVAAVVAVEEGTIVEARVAATGATDRPERLEPVEDELVGSPAERSAVARAAERASDGLDAPRLRSDVSASGEFRAHLLASYAERALETATDRATGETEVEGRDAGAPADARRGDRR